MKKLNNNYGITLLSLSVYIVALLLIIGILASIRVFFMNNIDVVKENGRYAAAFDKFNSYFVQDVKNNSNVSISSDSTVTENTIITFEDGTNYIYDATNQYLYRDKIKIASNVTIFNITKKNIMVNSVTKNILSVNIIIGTSDRTLFNKTIDYTLKYW